MINISNPFTFRSLISTGAQTSMRSKFYKRYTSSHRKRILIKICETKQKADESAEKLANEFYKSLAVFNPKISATAKAKRR